MSFLPRLQSRHILPIYTRITALDVTERVEIKGERRQAAERRQIFVGEVLANVTEVKLMLSDLVKPLIAQERELPQPARLSEALR